MSVLCWMGWSCSALSKWCICVVNLMKMSYSLVFCLCASGFLNYRALSSLHHHTIWLCGWTVVSLLCCCMRFLFLLYCYTIVWEPSVGMHQGPGSWNRWTQPHARTFYSLAYWFNQNKEYLYEYDLSKRERSRGASVLHPLKEKYS